MLQLLQLMSLVIGFEGFINGKVYVGIYTPKKEYGYVITENEIYLDTVYVNKLDIALLYIFYQLQHLP